jgi:hypothetical protein
VENRRLPHTPQKNAPTEEKRATGKNSTFNLKVFIQLLTSFYLTLIGEKMVKFRFTGRAVGVVDGLTVEEFEKIVQLLGEVREILKHFEYETTPLYKKVDEAWRESVRELEKMKKLEKEIEPLLENFKGEDKK